METHHCDDLKSKFEGENFPVRPAVELVQDFRATTCLANLVAVLEQQAAEDQQRISQKARKYSEYLINRNILVGPLKHWLIKVVFRRGYLETRGGVSTARAANPTPHYTSNPGTVRPGAGRRQKHQVCAKLAKMFDLCNSLH